MSPFGKYDLLEHIATGGMAEVFKACTVGESGFEQILAIKRILPHIAADAEFVSMFIDEAKIAVQLTHSNIAQIFDLGVQDGAYFIALEYVHGRDLRMISQTEARRGGAVPIPIACAIVMRVAEALDYAHRAESRDGRHLGVIHRDVSPQNVLVSFDGEVKVIDFGLAKAIGRITQTRTGMLKGKLAYLSPEQVSSQQVDWRSDIYALGIVLWEQLTGQRLFLRDNDRDTIGAVRASQVPPARAVASDVPHELDAIVRHALERDREKRYQRAQELHDAIEAYLFRRGEIVTRKRLSSYLRDLYPEEEVAPEELADLVGVELLDEHESDSTSPVPEDLRRALVASSRGERTEAPSRVSSSIPPPTLSTARNRPDDDPSILTLDEPIEPVAELIVEAPPPTATVETVWEEGTTAVVERRDTIPAPGDAAKKSDEDDAAIETSAALSVSELLPVEEPEPPAVDGDTTAVTLWKEERTARSKGDKP